MSRYARVALLYLPFVLLCALLISACASEEEQAQQAQQAVQKFDVALVSEEITSAVVSRTGGTDGVRMVCPDTVDKIVRLGCEATARVTVHGVRVRAAAASGSVDR